MLNTAGAWMDQTARWLLFLGMSLAVNAASLPAIGADSMAPSGVTVGQGWRFAVDPARRGETERWFAEDFDDSSWMMIKSGEPWEKQGVVHHGFGWYRQKILLPRESVGTPLVLELGELLSDDDVWFNGVRIGGISGEHKYKNWLTRSYTVPPSLIRYGEENTIAIRVWGGNLTFIGARSGLINPVVAKLDPYLARMRRPGGEEVPAQIFDLSEARRGMPFEIVFAFPPELAKNAGAQVSYRLSDLGGGEIKSGTTELTAGRDKLPGAVVGIDRETSQIIYFRGRFQAELAVRDAEGRTLYTGVQTLDRLAFFQRDETPLPSWPETFEDTPYGRLKLVDEIDCSTSLFDDPHPYLQGGLDHTEEQAPPGSGVKVSVNTILGKKARESGYGWFAYRIGRGALAPHANYLVRIEYPEDKPRYCPVSIQAGDNSLDVGWKSGVAADDVYDDWPLGYKWQWYDVILTLDERTVGTGGAGSAPSRNGIWVYFLNKLKPGAYYAMYSGGPAVARIKLYEIDPEKNAPEIRAPKGLPRRTLLCDWERQVDFEPADAVRYAKLMGYNAISPEILKWHFFNYGEPLRGYDSYNTDERGYWSWNKYDSATGKAEQALPGTATVHERFLDATRKYGVNYIPRMEWGGSMDLPREAWAIDSKGLPAKPNRYAAWCANLLNPLAWADLKNLTDHLIKPYVADNPQLAGALWRIRCDRVPISYGKDDLALFASETGTALPSGTQEAQAAWAATGAGREIYEDWWHRKRADFHRKLAELLQSYRPDMTLYYFNWDSDKFALINRDLCSWAFLHEVDKPAPEGGRTAYERDRLERRAFNASDYIDALRRGDFQGPKNIVRADYGLRPELYRNAKGLQLFAPANYRCYADMPDYLNDFPTGGGLAVSHAVTYDEVGRCYPNPQYECSMVTPGGPAFSMALELLAYFHGDARTLAWTSYTYGRGFAAEHRRFAQAFLALPAIPGTIVDQGDSDMKVRLYPSESGTYVGVAHKGYTEKTFTIRVPARPGARVTNLVTNQTVPAAFSGDELQFKVESAPMGLDAFLIE